MKILHTSDWHLGQLFYGKSRECEQAAFLEWLTEEIIRQQVDVVIVAGDLFDTGTPPSYARALYNQFIVRLHSEYPSCQLILLAGNHDSVAVLNESKSLLNALNTRVIAGAHLAVDPESIDDLQPINQNEQVPLHQLPEPLIPLFDRTGQAAAILCAIPFLRPSDLTRSRSGRSAQARQQHLQQQIAAYYQQLYQLAKAAAPDLPVVMTGHLTTVGASTSESVKEIYIGTLEAFPAQGFPPADYIALGHIHRSQKVARSEHIRYSGSPLALSFDELSQQKKVLLVELTTPLVTVTELPVPEFQPMARIQGDLEGIEQAFDDLEPRFRGLKPGQTLWLEVNIETQGYLADLQPRIEALAGDRPVEVLRIRRNRSAAVSLADHELGVQLDELTPEEVFLRRLSQESLTEDAHDALLDCFRQIYAEIDTANDAAKDTSAPVERTAGIERNNGA